MSEPAVRKPSEVCRRRSSPRTLALMPWRPPASPLTSPSLSLICACASARAGPLSTAGEVPESSVEQLFSKYDVDRSGLLDLDEFRTFVTEMNLPALDLSAMAQGTAKS